MKSKAIGIALLLAAVPAAGDTITMKTGEKVTGTVQQFQTMSGEKTAGAFMVEVDGHKRLITIEKIEAIEFGPTAGGRAAATAGRPGRKPSSPTAKQGLLSEAPGAAGQSELKHWMTNSSRKRHNEKCRYYKTGDGRPCGPDEGVPCKVCGG